MKQNIAVFVFLSLSILIHLHSYNFHNFIFPDGWIHLIVYVYHIFYPFFLVDRVTCKIFEVSKDTLQQKAHEFQSWPIWVSFSYSA